MSIVFDRAVTFYDRTRGVPPEAEAWIAQVVREHTPLREGNAVLELGVGTGRIALPLAQRNGYRYTGVDLSQGMMRQLRAKQSADAITLAQADITQLPFADGTFDAVVAVHVFHLVSHWQRAMDEAQRVLADGGVLLHGRNSHVGTSGIRRLRQKLDDLAHIRDDRRSAGLLDTADIRPQLEWRFGPPHEHTTPSWKVSMTVGQVLDQFRDRIYSGTWAIDDEVLNAALERGRAWALERWASLDEPLTDEQQFTWEVYRKATGNR
jgi:SAM-dependent methyltransferase